LRNLSLTESGRKIIRSAEAISPDCHSLRETSCQLCCNDHDRLYLCLVSVCIHTLVEYEVFHYLDKIEGWNEVIIWIDRSNDIVSAIIVCPNYKSKDQRTYLSYWAKHLGTPENIYWTKTPYFRHLAWPKRGISVKTSIVPPANEEFLRISELTVYVPIESSKYLGMALNVPYLKNISSENLFVRGKSDIIDTVPLDPFDWKLIKAAFPY
jgi:hypothetical protein